MDSVRVLPLTEKLDSLPLEKKLEPIRNCSAEDISCLVAAVIPPDRLPLRYLENLSTGDRTVCYRAAMICWTVTGSMVPREMQFRAMLSDFQKRDCLIARGQAVERPYPLHSVFFSTIPLPTQLLSRLDACREGYDNGEQYQS